jgi:signal transduction histidine kinase
MTAQTAPTGAPTTPLEPRRSRRAAHARPAEGPPPAAARSTSGRRLRFAPKTVRARIVCLLALPVISLTALWGIAAVNTVSTAYTDAQLRTFGLDVALPLDNTVLALQQERSAADAYLATPDADPSTLNTRISASRSAAAALVLGVGQSAGSAADLNAMLAPRLATTTKAIVALPGIRTLTLGHSLSPAAADAAYAAAIEDAFAVQATLAGTSGSPATAQAALELAEARDQITVQDSDLAAAHAAGSLSEAEYLQFTGAVYAERSYLQQAEVAVPDPTASPAGQTLTGLQNAVLTAGFGTQGAAAASAPAWNGAEAAVGAALDGDARLTAMPAFSDPYSTLLTTGSGFGVLLGFFALLISLLISVGIGRRLVSDLVGLRDYALDLAGRRLPETMAKLRAGQNVVPQEQAPPLDPDAGELGQVADALAVASRAAMRAAVERAELVSGVSGVFLNLARRSQVLVHRQLALLDAMERRIEEPDHLEDLFRLDHLATRMRRHAEGLIILSGATPGRGWRNPVDLTDVVRAAAAEAEDYPRVEVRRMPRARVLGPVVADLTHLLAELIENATSFSPPHTRVVVGGEPVGSGFAIEIEDRGLGMSPEALHEANRRIGESSGDDLFDSDRLGLFVVSRLARRHEIRVSLCSSAYGGITAVVLIPSGVMQPPGETGDVPGRGMDAAVNGHGALGPGPRAELPGAGLSPANAPHPVRPDGLGPVDVPAEGSTTRIAALEDLAPQSSAAAALPGALPHSNGHAHDSATALPQPFESFESFDPGHGAQGPGFGEPEQTALGPDGLPRRVRQANLAPQLRAVPAPGASADPEVSETAGATEQADARPPRTPEQNRATMSAFQRGFVLGRADGPAAPPPPMRAEASGPAAADDKDQRGDEAR